MNVQRGRGKVHAKSGADSMLPTCGGNRNSEGYRETSAPVDCKNCLTALEKEATQEVPEKATYGNPEVTGHGAPESANVPSASNANEDTTGETMATTTKNDINTDEGKAVLEQIDANTERARSLAEAENVDALVELAAETETLISSLSGKDSIKAKKAKREAWTEASTLTEKPKAKTVATKPAEGVVVAKTWDQYAGTQELVTMGAEKVAEGVKAHVKVSTLAKDVAAVAFDVWTRIPNKAEAPDLMGDSDQAKKASKALYEEAGKGFEDNYDNRQALKRLIRSVQDQRSDVRAEWLRSLDGDDDVAAERRTVMAKVLEGKPEDAKASEWVAKVYGASLLGVTERKRIEYAAKKEAAELTAGPAGSEGGEGEGEGEGSGEDTSADTSTPDERATKLTDKLLKDISSGKPEDFEAASDETKAAIREKLEKAQKALKEMILATM